MPERVTKENSKKWEGLPPVEAEGGSLSPEELVKLAQYIKDVFGGGDEDNKDVPQEAEEHVPEKED